MPIAKLRKNWKWGRNNWSAQKSCLGWLDVVLKGPTAVHGDVGSVWHHMTWKVQMKDTILGDQEGIIFVIQLSTHT